MCIRWSWRSHLIIPLLPPRRMNRDKPGRFAADSRCASPSPVATLPRRVVLFLYFYDYFTSCSDTAAAGCDFACYHIFITLLFDLIIVFSFFHSFFFVYFWEEDWKYGY